MKKTMLLVLLLITNIINNYCYEFTFCYPKTDNILEQEFLNTLKKIFNITIFIETGTYNGDTSACAAQIFDEVHTIELSPEFYNRACHRFKNNSRVTVHLGDSKHVLPQLLATIDNQKILFWLDGHYSAGNTAKGETNTPILQELAAIKASKINNSIIMIDDIRLFQQPHIDASQTSVGGYPSFKQTIEAIKEINPAYQMVLLGDILLAFPENERLFISPVAHACTQLRFFDNNQQTVPTELLTTIAQASGSEKEALHKLFTVFGNEPISEQFGFNKFYIWWYALNIQNHSPCKSLALLEHANQYGLPK